MALYHPNLAPNGSVTSPPKIEIIEKGVSAFGLNGKIQFKTEVVSKAIESAKSIAAIVLRIKDTILMSII